MNILIVGGTHGNEQTGLQMVAQTEDAKVEGITAVVANAKAVQANKRYIDEDLNRIFNTEGDSHEHSLIPFLEEKMKDKFVIDFHNTTADSMSCLIVNSTSLTMFAVATALGLNKILIIPSQNNLISGEGGVGVEISRNEMKKYSAKKMFQAIKEMKEGKISDNKYSDIEIYEMKLIIPRAYASKNKTIKNGDKINDHYVFFYGEEEYDFDYIAFDKLSKDD